ncbi:type II toxin-antitoxin system RelE/ParE family toxin [Pantoea sp.]|uniref:type II toxin-antitoxin system RelE/ParE family toxin n=1 Tax=Pantoea sp. TaxID=69393 RepID=UPI0028A5BBCA|nr:type II toxin-antitoxin system RelE/ParE family toxin [Pantoea sp.]
MSSESRASNPLDYLLIKCALVAIAADDRLAAMVNILKENPVAGVQAGRTVKHRKLGIPHFPFIVVYVADETKVSILRVLHTSRKIAGR